jgi:hypothetical protein
MAPIDRLGFYVALVDCPSIYTRISYRLVGAACFTAEWQGKRLALPAEDMEHKG